MLRRIVLVTPLYMAVGLLLVNLFTLQATQEANAAIAANLAAISTNNSISSNKELSGQPIKVTIPSRELEVNVLPGSYDISNRSWTLTKANAHFATDSSLANNRQGQTFIYGHNTKEVLGDAAKVRPGDILNIETENGYLFSYQFINSKTVWPTNTTVLNFNSKQPSLLLMLCTGSWNEYRLAMNFQLIGAKEL